MTVHDLNYVQVDSSENWEQATLILRRSGYEIKIIRTGVALIAEKFSKQSSVSEVLVNLMYVG